MAKISKFGDLNSEWKVREEIRSTGNSLCDKISAVIMSLNYKKTYWGKIVFLLLYLVIYWNAILDKFKFSAQTNWKALFKSYSIVSKAELLRNKKGELVKIKNDLVTDNLEFYLFQRWEPSDLIVIHLLFLYICVSVFLYYGISVFLFQWWKPSDWLLSHCPPIVIHH